MVTRRTAPTDLALPALIPALAPLAPLPAEDPGDVPLARPGRPRVCQLALRAGHDDRRYAVVVPAVVSGIPLPARRGAPRLRACAAAPLGSASRGAPRACGSAARDARERDFAEVAAPVRAVAPALLAAMREPVAAHASRLGAALCRPLARSLEWVLVVPPRRHPLYARSRHLLGTFCPMLLALLGETAPLWVRRAAVLGQWDLVKTIGGHVRP